MTNYHIHEIFIIYIYKYIYICVYKAKIIAEFSVNEISISS